MRLNRRAAAWLPLIRIFLAYFALLAATAGKALLADDADAEAATAAPATAAPGTAPLPTVLKTLSTGLPTAAVGLREPI